MKNILRVAAPALETVLLAAVVSVAVVVVAVAATACTPEDANTLAARHGVLTGGDPFLTAAGQDNTFDHARESIGGSNGITDLALRKQEELAIGAPDDVARLHGAQKISYASLGKMLTDLGVSTAGGGGGGAKPTTANAGTLYTAGKNALGAPIFSSRTPEMSNPSTSALAKEYDIFVAGAADVIANIGKSKRCPGVVLVDAGQLTEDGISCLIGKPASADYVTLANKLVADSGDPTKGTAIAVATILAAAHISE